MQLLNPLSDNFTCITRIIGSFVILISWQATEHVWQVWLQAVQARTQGWVFFFSETLLKKVFALFSEV